MEDVSAYLGLLRNHRRALHKIPELGENVPETCRYVREALVSCLPDEIQSFTGFGLRALFRAEGATRTIAFRADMDALPIREEADVPFRSQREGCMHACGHDGHMANLLALAQWIADHRAEIKVNVVLIFEPAEETTGGAKPLIDAGALRDPQVSRIYGLHLMPDVPKGKIAVCPGPVMASTSELNFVIHGMASHGAMPHLGKDAITAAAHLITLLNSAVARTVDPCREAVITIGRVEAGTQRNILADTARLYGICRTFSDEVYRGLEGQILSICDGVSKAFGVSAQFTRGVYYPCTVNDPEETGRVIRLLGDRYQHAVPRMTADDFSYFQLEVPGVYVFCGCRDEVHQSALHTPSFGFDETALLPGLGLFADLILDASLEEENHGDF